LEVQFFVVATNIACMRYPLALRVEILALYRHGLSVRSIAKKFGKDPGSVSRFLRTFMARPGLVDRAGRGRRRTLTLRDEHVVKRVILSGECDTAAEISRQALNLGLPRVSEATVRRALRRQGLVARIMRKKPALTKRHKALRLAWAKERRNWTAADWERVIFSDESKVVLVNCAGRSWCWRGPGSNPYDERVVQPTKKFGGGSLMVWGCMSSRGVGNLCRIYPIMTADVYVEILEHHMLSSKAWLLPHKNAPYVFQQDNDVKHTSRKTKEWLQRNHVDILSWPPQSPDLNPMENIWSVFKQRVREGAAITSVDRLWERMEDVWWGIEPDRCARLIATMPARVQAVIQAKGGHTRF
jgi:transposase